MISVIIPVYNCENTILGTLDSITKYTDTAYEIIAIDDGSTDQSGKLLDQYASHCEKLKVIHQENQGNSLTRDTGIQASSGEYIVFVDGDDLLVEHALDTIQENLEDTDLLIFGFRTEYMDEGYSLVRYFPNRTYSDAKEAASILLSEGGFNLLWNKVYRASYIKGHHDFPVMKTTGQDFIFNCHVFPRMKKVKSIDAVLYRYCKRAIETMVTRYVKDGWENLSRKEEALRNMFEAFGQGKEKAYCDYMIREYEVYLINLFSPECPLRKEEKINQVQTHLMNASVQETIQKATPLGSYAKLFQKEVLKKNAKALVNKYTLLCGFRDRFGGIYRRLRRFLNQHNAML